MMMNYWKSKQSQTPTLATYKHYLAGPAPSAPVDSLLAGKLLRPDRYRLSDDTFEKFMTIKCSLAQLSNVIVIT